MKKSLDQIQREIEEKRIRKISEDKERDQQILNQREKSRIQWIKDMKIYETSSFSPFSSSSSSGGTSPLSRETSNLSILINDFEAYNNTPSLNSITIEILSDGPNPPVISERGIIYGTFSDPSIGDIGVFNSIDGGTDIGEFIMENVDIDNSLWDEEIFIRAYVITLDNEIIHSPSGLSPSISFTPGICLAEGTKVKLSNNLYKNIEDIEYSDNLLVWDFDLGEFSSANPLWIKREESAGKYNLLKFSDGSELKTISQHRIFNKEMGKFTYPMTSETPIGTSTFNSNGEEIVLINKEVIIDKVRYYNIITKNHINIFANDILTSCRYNNIYPIENMKFVKDGRSIRSKSEFDIPEEFYYGLRVGEQTFEAREVQKYVKRLEVRSKEVVSEFV